jgi:hypothetical protein
MTAQWQVYSKIYDWAMDKIMRGESGAVEKIARAMILAKLMRIDGLYYLLRSHVYINMEQLPDYLKPHFGIDGAAQNTTQLLWKALALKTEERELGLLEIAKLWILKNTVGLTENQKRLLQILDNPKVLETCTPQQIIEVIETE